MATFGIVMKADYPGLKSLIKGIKGLGDPKYTAETLKEALEAAVYPAYLRLREVTPVGPTGNLKAAAGYIVKAYPKNGGAVGLVGYRRSGTANSESSQGGSVRRTTGSPGDRAYHQWIVEFGTAGRAIKRPITLKRFDRRSPVQDYVRVRNGVVETVRGRGIMHSVNPPQGPYYIASSFNRLGPFKFVAGTAGRMQTDPAYPNAFFRKSKGSLMLPPMPVGGRTGRPPLQTAFAQSQSQVAFILEQKLRISLEEAVNAIAFNDTGTL
jgi:hypothetical protein